MVELVSFAPFKSVAHALENANDVSEGAIVMRTWHLTHHAILTRFSQYRYP